MSIQVFQMEVPSSCELSSRPSSTPNASLITDKSGGSANCRSDVSQATDTTVSVLQEAPSSIFFQYPLCRGVVPPARWAHTATAVGRNIVIYGGVGSTVLDDLCILDTDTLSWRQVTTYTARSKDRPEKVLGHSAAAIGNLLWIFGGQQGRRYLRNLFCFNIESNTWSRCGNSDSMPSARAGHAMTTVLNTTIYMFGGQGKRLYNDLFKLENGSVTFVKIDALGKVPAPRRGHSFTWDGQDLLICFGGITASGSDNSLHVLSISRNEWMTPQTSGVPPSARTQHTAAQLAPHLILFFGGCNSSGTFFNDSFVLDTRSFTWHKPQHLNTTPAPRYHHTCSVINNRLFLYGGINAKQTFEGVVVVETKFNTDLSFVAEELFRMSSETYGQQPLPIFPGSTAVSASVGDLVPSSAPGGAGGQLPSFFSPSPLSQSPPQRMQMQHLVHSASAGTPLTAVAAGQDVSVRSSVTEPSSTVGSGMTSLGGSVRAGIAHATSRLDSVKMQLTDLLLKRNLEEMHVQASLKAEAAESQLQGEREVRQALSRELEALRLLLSESESKCSALTVSLAEVRQRGTRDAAALVDLRRVVSELETTIAAQERDAAKTKTDAEGVLRELAQLSKSFKLLQGEKMSMQQHIDRLHQSLQQQQQQQAIGGDHGVLGDGLGRPMPGRRITPPHVGSVDSAGSAVSVGAVSIRGGILFNNGSDCATASDAGVSGSAGGLASCSSVSSLNGSAPNPSYSSYSYIGGNFSSSFGTSPQLSLNYSRWSSSTSSAASIPDGAPLVGRGKPLSSGPSNGSNGGSGSGNPLPVLLPISLQGTSSRFRDGSGLPLRLDPLLESSVGISYDGENSVPANNDNDVATASTQGVCLKPKSNADVDVREPGMGGRSRSVHRHAESVGFSGRDFVMRTLSESEFTRSASMAEEVSSDDEESVSRDGNVSRPGATGVSDTSELMFLSGSGRDPGSSRGFRRPSPRREDPGQPGGGLFPGVFPADEHHHHHHHRHSPLRRLSRGVEDVMGRLGAASLGQGNSQEDDNINSGGSGEAVNATASRLMGLHIVASTSGRASPTPFRTTSRVGPGGDLEEDVTDVDSTDGARFLSEFGMLATEEELLGAPSAEQPGGGGGGSERYTTGQNVSHSGRETPTLAGPGHGSRSISTSQASTERGLSYAGSLASPLKSSPGVSRGAFSAGAAPRTRSRAPSGWSTGGGVSNSDIFTLRQPQQSQPGQAHALSPKSSDLGMEPLGLHTGQGSMSEAAVVLYDVHGGRVSLGVASDGQLRRVPPQHGELRSSTRETAAAAAELAAKDAELRAAAEASTKLSSRVSELVKEVTSLRTEVAQLSAAPGTLEVLSDDALELLEQRLEVAARCTREAILARRVAQAAAKRSTEANQCALCMERPKSVVFSCGHQSCAECSSRIQATCPFCRASITARIKLFDI